MSILLAARVPCGAEPLTRMVKLEFEAVSEHMPRWTDRWRKEIERR
jgi:hypothetical protein